MWKYVTVPNLQTVFHCGQWMGGNTWDLECWRNIIGNSEAEANRPSLARDSCHSYISEGAGGFLNTRYSPCLMPASPMVLLCCTPTLLESSLLETQWQIAFRKSADTHLLQWKELSPLLWVWRVGDCHHTTLSCMVNDVIPYGEACYFTCSNFVCLIKLIFKTDSVKSYNVEVLI